MTSTNPNDQLDAEKARQAVSKQKSAEGAAPVRDCRDAPSDNPEDREKHATPAPMETGTPKDHHLRKSQR